MHECVCVPVCLCVHVQRPERISGVLLYLSLTYFLEIGYLIQPGTCLPFQVVWLASPSNPPTWAITQSWGCKGLLPWFSSFTWVLWIQTQFLVVALQALFLTVRLLDSQDDSRSCQIGNQSKSSQRVTSSRVSGNPNLMNLRKKIQKKRWQENNQFIHLFSKCLFESFVGAWFKGHHRFHGSETTRGRRLGWWEMWLEKKTALWLKWECDRRVVAVISNDTSRAATSRPFSAAVHLDSSDAWILTCTIIESEY